MAGLVAIQRLAAGFPASQPADAASCPFPSQPALFHPADRDASRSQHMRK